jgi:hypothetical protein
VNIVINIMFYDRCWHSELLRILPNWSELVLQTSNFRSPLNRGGVRNRISQFHPGEVNGSISGEGISLELTKS